VAPTNFDVATGMRGLMGWSNNENLITTGRNDNGVCPELVRRTSS
jgi:hypothetical protein